MNTYSNSSSSNWNDFNDAEAQQGAFDLIPKGTIVKLRMTIKPGGHDDHSQGWTGGYATQSFDTGAVYLSCEFIVTAGPFAKRKMWSNVGLHSNKGPAWGQMGRSFIRAALNSARGIQPKDNTPQAAAARRIESFSDLDGLEFIARIDVEKDGKGEDRNVVKLAIEPDHKDYAVLMGGAPKVSSGGGQSGPAALAATAFVAPARVAAPASQAPVSGKPSWAQ